MTASDVTLELAGERSALRPLVRDIWRSRLLIRMLAKQDFLVRYRRASFGILWAVGLPVVQGAIMAFVFTHVVRIQTGSNYPTFVLAGIMPWSFFSGTISSASTSIVDGQNLGTKIYFPRAVFPFVSVGANLYGFFPGLVVLVVFALGFGVHLGLNVLWLIPGTMVMVLLAVGFSLVFAALHVYFRDIRYVLQAAIMAWFYASPVLYPLERAHGTFRAVLLANPATGMIELFRKATVGVGPAWSEAVLFSLCWSLGLIVLAAILHRRYDRVFVDLL
ncbi:MAG: lipopolysaccharide transport system permease protein [Actinomycetota bacterium]|nr:lipopolysaccharide transport system permease protein [Actinomycetota bacterium]